MTIATMKSYFTVLMLNVSFVVAALPPVDNPTFTKEERLAVVEAEKRNSEAASKIGRTMALLTADNVVEMIAGDFSSLDVMLAKQDLRALWFLFNRACFDRLGESNFSQRKPASEGFAFYGPIEFNKKAKEEIRERLLKIPGHAKYLGDLIDQYSNEPGHFYDRGSLMRSLGDLGGVEAVQQLGRFIEDGRRPEGDFFDPLSGSTNPFANWRDAVPAMHKALGAASPIYIPTSRFVPGSRDVSMQPYETMIQWWKSDAAKPYRDWNKKTGAGSNWPTK